MPETVTCGHCGQESIGQRFCGSCGADLPRKCSSCGAPSPPDFRFCGRCGGALEEPAAPERTRVEERRTATVVFADLSGFTALSERMDPEDVRSMVDACMSTMGEVVESFGGSVDKVVGDELMAVFGAPVSHGDDAERAVRAALEMHRCAASHKEEFGELRLRIGVNTGEVMFAPVGPVGARRFTVMGDTVNVASRLCGAVAPGGTLVGDETQRATRRAIGYEPVEPLQVKGKVAPLSVWLAVEPISTPAEGARPAVPLIGRDQELDILRVTWERVVSERRPHLVTVLGSPGIGKTRLAQEFSALVEQQGGRVLRGRSLPYGERTGYGAFAQQVKQAADIFDTDPVPLAREKLGRAAARLFPAEEWEDIAGRLALLIGLGTEGTSGEKGPLFSSARRFVESVASERPTVFLSEDLHWSDPSLIDLAEFLAGRCREAPALFLVMARPELLDVRGGWGGGLTSSTMLELEPLSVTSSRELVASLQPGIAEPAITARLVETAGGNPLFIEELMASFTERAAEMAASLPSNVQTIIAARLDALPPHEREVLFDASVVGKIFWRGALASLGTEAGLDDLLDSLEARDLIRPEAVSRLKGDRQFAFKHMLIREVAYGTLPKAARRARHAAVAQFIEEAAGDRVDESASLLAHHWREAESTDRAVHFLLMAAEQARRSWAKTEAIALYGQALDLIPDDHRAQRATVRLRRATAIVESTDFPAGAAELDAVLPGLAGRERAEALLHRGRAAFWLAEVETIASSAREATLLGEKLADEPLRVRGLALASHAHMAEGTLDSAAGLGEAALEAWPSGQHRPEHAVHCAYVGAIHCWAGHYDRAVERAEAGYALGIETESVEGMLAGGANLGMALTGAGRHEEALSLMERVVAQGREFELVPRLTARAMNIWAGTLREVGDPRRARELNQEAVEAAQRVAFPFPDLQGRIDLLFGQLADGEIGPAERAWPELWEAALRSKGFHFWLMGGRLRTARAEIALALGRAEEAATAAAEAVAAAEGNSRLKYEVTSRVVLGSALGRMGRTEDAVAELRRAHRDADRLGHPPTRWRAAFALAQTLARMGDDNGAHAVASVAAGTARQFAETLADEHRAKLLGSPRIAEVLAFAS